MWRDKQKTLKTEPRDADQGNERFLLIKCSEHNGEYHSEEKGNNSNKYTKVMKHNIQKTTNPFFFLLN